jgi:hypothetical protein
VYYAGFAHDEVAVSTDPSNPPGLLPDRQVGELKKAIDTNDIARVRDLMTRDPELHRAPLGYGKDGPLSGTRYGS